MPTTPEPAWSVDTSILVYATMIDPPSAQKQRVAQELLARLFKSPLGCLAAQVLSEYLSVVLRRKTMAPALALETVGVWSLAARVLDVTTQAYEKAWKLAATHNYQVWDALVISVCAEHGVKTLYSEDAGSLKRPLGVHVINPFAKPGAP